MNDVNRVMFGYAVPSAPPMFGCQEASEPPKSPSDQATQMARTRCGPDLDESVLGPMLDGRALARNERSGAPRHAGPHRPGTPPLCGYRVYGLTFPLAD
jgi:hypothetical protein